MRDDLMRSGARDNKRLILGLDAGNSTCSDLAVRIEDRVGGKLAVRNLKDPEVQGWRELALGGDAEWVPTLFEVEGAEIRAWAGWRMGWALSRTIGPEATWQVMQALEEIGAVPRVKGNPAVQTLPDEAARA